jgi:hypothetical protein
MMSIKIKLSIYRYHNLQYIPNTYKIPQSLKENKHTFAPTYAHNS